MRTTILTLTVLTLGLGLAGCGGGGGLWDGYYIGAENGQHFGDDSWENNDFVFNKAGFFVTFPFSEQGAAVQAGTEVVAFEQGSNVLLVRGTTLPAYSVAPTGALLRDDAVIGHIVYTETDDGQIGTALLSLTGLGYEIVFEDEQAHLNETDAPVRVAPLDRAPRNELNVPVAQPAI